ncbi:MAG: hypothetical protein HGA87_02500 [Desulfobulbaceae bacterium]|nr:hypothetical protein [Desulfobulbaceae bacterium]
MSFKSFFSTLRAAMPWTACKHFDVCTVALDEPLPIRHPELIDGWTVDADGIVTREG